MTDTKQDYRDTVRLPQTTFEMRAGLAKKEPEIIAFWDKNKISDKIYETAKGRPSFVLHDGPPYANGSLHIGHALNKILKDVINRYRYGQGFNSYYVPGWDCHGLPIEWKIEEKYRTAGQDKDQIPVNDFRQECREFAAHWVQVQTEEFKRLGIQADWDRRYTSMDNESEAQIVRELGKFLTNGGIYRGAKPVLWSVVEKTALADAEVEYHEHKSIQVWVRFSVTRTGKAAKEDLVGSDVVIWTTTPWTIPANLALGYSKDITYGLYEVLEVEETATAKIGDRLILAENLAPSVQAQGKITRIKLVRSLDAAELEGLITAHPFHGKGYDHEVPLLIGDFVTSEQGTGFVHIAPAHGQDDFQLCQKHDIHPRPTIDESGLFYEHMPLVHGQAVYDQQGKLGDANFTVLRELASAGKILAKANLKHSYPYSWRSKTPLVFRNTAQWFISMDANDLRHKALKEIERIPFYPEAGKRRLFSMIEDRPDWCISRQRTWGVPLPIFMEKRTGEPLRDPVVIERIAKIYEEESSDAWFSSPAERFLGPDYDPNDYEQIQDVVEVWFDSGSSHAFVLENRENLSWPADLYLEGSDQHRGWFHTSLLESVGTRGEAPYKAVLTHGFVLDEKGEKMSKSLGNVTLPEEVAQSHGIDILRLWVIGSDYSSDLRIGPDILKSQSDIYRRFRNTLRFILGNLHGFKESQKVAYGDLPEPERWILNRIATLDQEMNEALKSYDHHRIYTLLHTFATNELSSFYFDIRKDTLYCEGEQSLERCATQTVLAELFSWFMRWLSPILVFTTEEAWQERRAYETANPEVLSLTFEESVHLVVSPDVPKAWHTPELEGKWTRIAQIRQSILGALEIKRKDKEIGSSLQAAPKVFVSEEDLQLLATVDLGELALTSGIDLSTDPAPDDAYCLDNVKDCAVVVQKAQGHKCERCWKIVPTLKDDLCPRCHATLQDS